ncbi:MAG: bifunctional adenosylcobinamide kinase/adenosylcobinamide-phosphate guanylyltransferase [Ruminococcus sp.]|nr:bifunctional adenosylcobinamide kinase/adenosylcobinamide-phosphate guanylyltransferase [Ruminococcus sp.]
MTILVTGGSKCGKSSFAENCLKDFKGYKYYIATMKPYGEDAYEIIQRHRKARAEKNFITIEKYTDVHELEFPENSAVLLECTGNLLANEMFSENGIENPVDKILKGLKKISLSVSEFVIVSNEVSSDGISYPPETMKYIEYLCAINRGILEFADKTAECVYGIPVLIRN